MSRSGYSDDYGLALYRGQVASAIRGKRGQSLLRDLLAALDAMPVKRLITGYLIDGGDACALGVVGMARGVPMEGLDPEDAASVAKAFDIAEPLAREVAYENDEHWRPETPEQRWARMRDWAAALVDPVEKGAEEKDGN